MKFFCWLLVAVLLVDHLQAESSHEDEVRGSQTGEGSGDNSNSHSEETTESKTIANEPLKSEIDANVLILPPDESAPSSGEKNDTDAEEVIKGALTGASSTITEAGVHVNSPDLIILGAFDGNSKPQTGAHHGKNASEVSDQNEVQSDVLSSSSRDELRTEVDDSVEISLIGVESQNYGKVSEHKILSDGKGGAMVKSKKVTENTEGDDQLLDGKSGKMVPTPDKVHVVPPGDAETTTMESTGNWETPSEQPGSIATTSEQPSIANGVTANASVAETETPTHPIVEEASESTPSGTEPSTNTSSGKTSATPEGSRKPGPSAENIDDLSKLDFQEGARASYRSPQALSQNLSKLQCTGAFCGVPSIKSITCNRVASLPSVNATSSPRFIVPIHWTCGSSDFEPDFRITNPSVICEGYTHPEDKWIVKNSCTLSFQLDKINSSPLIGTESVSKTSTVAIILMLLAVAGVGYFIIKAVLLKKSHGHWMPSYCALPLQTRMNFRRKRQPDVEEVHFDMSDEDMGRSRRRNYGSQ